MRLVHAHTKDPTGVLFVNQGNGEPGTGVELPGYRGGPGTSTVLGGHGDQPTHMMLDKDVLQQATYTKLASILQLCKM